MKANKIVHKKKVLRSPSSASPIMRTRPSRKPISKSPPPRKLNIGKRPIKATINRAILPPENLVPQSLRLGKTDCTIEDLNRIYMSWTGFSNWKDIFFPNLSDSQIIEACKQSSIYQPPNVPLNPNISRPSWIKGLPNWLTVVGALGLITGIVLIFRKKKK